MVSDYDFEGPLWRVIPSGAISAYDLRYTDRQSSGRWHHEDGVGCFYASLTERGELEEFKRRREGEYLPLDRHHLVRVEMKVESVMDLTSERELSKHPLDKENMVNFSDEDYKKCRLIGDRARQRGFNAIRSLCAPAPDEENLNIFANSKAPAWIAVNDVSVRAPVSEHLS